LCDGCKQKTTYREERSLTNVSDIVAVSFNKYFGKHSIPYPTFFMVDNNRYNMIGIIDHFGVLNAGHYVCRTKRFDEDDQCEKYYVFDDERVGQIDNETFSKIMEETYMIFYEKNNI
jgi:ubiquitin C-terminal hydrolase